MRRMATASAILGTLAVVCGSVLVHTGTRGLHMWPPDRGKLWAEMWSDRLTLPTLALAAAALALALLAARESPAARIAKAGGLLAMGGILLAVWMPATEAWRRAHSRPHIECLSQVKNIAVALEVYLSDYGRFPGQDRWCDTLDEYIRNRDVYHCPQAEAAYGYAYNTTLDGSDAHMVDPARVPAVFDADGGWNAHGGKELLPDFPRHLGGDNYGFPDGHATWYARKRPPGEVRWDTKWPREPNGPSLQWRPEPEFQKP